jgi:hypothetical protein
MEFVKASLSQLDKSSHMASHVEFSELSASLAPGAKADVSKEETNEVWDAVAEAMFQRAKKEFGPVLAKHKYQAAMSRI